MKEINENMDMEEALNNQIPEANVDSTTIKNADTEAPHTSMVGQQLGTAFMNRNNHEMNDEQREEMKSKGLSTVGANIFEQAAIRDGWDVLDRALLGDRNIFYPENWEFRVRPANTEAVKNWSMIDDENVNVIDDVFTEMLKTCLQIVTPNGPIPSTKINSWDRFFFILIIREYTFMTGEKKVKFSEDCPSCDNPVEFNLTSSSLLYEMPEPEVMHYYNPVEQVWTVDSEEYDVNAGVIKLYLPTVEKEANIKAWMIDRIQNNKKVDQVFIKFLTWMAPKIAKDLTVAKQQIRDYEYKYKMLDSDTFTLMNDIITNIWVTPAQTLITKCPICGEEVTAKIQFQHGIRDLFNMSSGRKKFGKK